MESDNNLNDDYFASIRNLSPSQIDAFLNFNTSPEKAANKLSENNNQNDDECTKRSDGFPSQMLSQTNLSTFDFSLNPMKDLSSTWNFPISQKTNESISLSIECTDRSEKTMATTTITGKKVNSSKSLRIDDDDDFLKNWNESNIASPDNILETVDFDEIKILEQLDDDINKAEYNKKRKCQTQPEFNRPKTPRDDLKIPCPAELCIQSSSGQSISNPFDYLRVEYDDRTSLNRTPPLEIIEDNNIDCTPSSTSRSHNSVVLSEGENLNDIIDKPSKKPTSYGVDVTLTPPSIQKLYEEVTNQYSEFAFVYALSAQLCQDRVPMDCYVTLKMGLLLSLCSISNKLDVPPLAIIALGNDVYTIDYLMKTIGQLATRFIGPCEEFKPPSINVYRNHKWIEADPIILSQNGVYYVGDWSRLKLAQSERLFKILECAEVNIEKTPIKLPLQTAIWSHWRTFNYSTKDQQLFNKFAKIFGIAIYVAEDNREALVNYILQQSSTRLYESTIDQLSIKDEEMRDFLILITGRLVDWMPEANELLEKYFVSLRKARPDCLGKQAFTSLKQFAESFAKLSLRHEVLKNDVISSIILCEHFIQHVFGVQNRNDNVTDYPAPPYFGAMSFIGMVDDYFEQFHQWLDAFIEKYGKTVA